jgi:hypothetical protein
VKIVAVNEYDLEAALIKTFYEIEAGKPASDYYYTLFGFHIS